MCSFSLITFLLASLLLIQLIPTSFIHKIFFSWGWTERAVLPRLVIDVVTPTTTNTFFSQAANQNSGIKWWRGINRKKKIFCSCPQFAQSTFFFSFFQFTISSLSFNSLFFLFPSSFFSKFFNFLTGLNLRQLIVTSIFSFFAGLEKDVNHIVFQFHSQKSKVSPAPAIRWVRGGRKKWMQQKRKSGRVCLLWREKRKCEKKREGDVLNASELEEEEGTEPV